MEQINKRKRKENNFSSVKKRNVSSVFLKLPNEIWSIIIREVPLEFIIAIKLTCKNFNNIHVITKKIDNMKKSMVEMINSPCLSLSYLTWAQSIGHCFGIKYIIQTIKEGYLKILKCFYKSGRLRSACAKHFIYKDLHKKQRLNFLFLDTCCMSTRKGDTKTLKYIFKKINFEYEDILNVLYISIKRLNITAIKWIYPRLDIRQENNFVCVYQDIIFSGRLDILKYLYSVSEINQKKHRILLIDAITMNQTNIYEWFIEKGFTFSKSSIIKFAREGKLKHMKVLHGIHKSETIWTNHMENACGAALKKGNYECFDYAFENGSPFGKEELYHLVLRGDLVRIKKFHQKGEIMDKDHCALASKYGYIDIIRHVVQNKCIYDENIVHEAILNEHLNILVFISRKTSLIIGKWAYMDAIYSNCHDIMKWLFENGFPFNARKCLETGNETFKLLYEEYAHK